MFLGVFACFNLSVNDCLKYLDISQNTPEYLGAVSKKLANGLMRKILKTIPFVLLLGFLTVAPANSNEIKMNNVKVTLPDSLEVTGSETGINDRNCTFKVSLDAEAGSTIPLRFSITAILKDSLGTTVDVAYWEAQVEGVVHQDVTGGFRCNASAGTLKPPYYIWVPGYADHSPISLTYVNKVSSNSNKINPSPAPTNSSSTASSSLQEKYDSLMAKYQDLQAQLESLKTQNSSLVAGQNAQATSYKNLISKLNKICNSKPKPKGC